MLDCILPCRCLLAAYLADHFFQLGFLMLLAAKVGLTNLLLPNPCSKLRCYTFGSNAISKTCRRLAECKNKRRSRKRVAQRSRNEPTGPCKLTLEQEVPKLHSASKVNEIKSALRPLTGRDLVRLFMFERYLEAHNWNDFFSAFVFFAGTWSAMAVVL